MANGPQRFGRGKNMVIVSVVRDGKAAVSNDVSRYASLDEREWRWLVEEAGPKVLAEMRAQAAPSERELGPQGGDPA